MIPGGRDLETAQLHQADTARSPLATRSPAMHRFATLLGEAARHDLERETTVGTFRKDPFYRLNVLELRSTLQRMLILSPGGRLDVDALPERIPR